MVFFGEKVDVYAFADFWKFIAFDDGRSSNKVTVFEYWSVTNSGTEIDEGHLSTDLKMATKEVERLLATMKSSDPEEEFLPGSPYIEVFRSIWFRVASVSTSKFSSAWSVLTRYEF